MSTSWEPLPANLPKDIADDLASWQASTDGMIARGMERVRRSRAQLVARGLYDEQGNRLTTEVPYDMRPGSGSDVGG